MREPPPLAADRRTALHAKKGGRLSPSAARTVAPATLFVAQTEKYRASTIPWVRARATRRRQVSWLAGHSLMVGLPRQWVHKAPPSGCPSFGRERRDHLAHRLQLQGQLWN